MFIMALESSKSGWSVEDGPAYNSMSLLVIASMVKVGKVSVHWLFSLCSQHSW